MKAPRIILLIILLAVAVSLPAAQNPTTGRGFSPDAVFQTGTFDNVNLFSGSLAISIPLGSTYTAGDRLKYGFTLSYNSSVWEYERRVTGQGVRTETVPARNANAGFGWMLTMGELFISPVNNQYVYVGPDGGEHAFVSKLHFENETATQGIGYANDGSYLRLRSIPGGGWSVDAPDGVQRHFECAYSCTAQNGGFIRFRLTKIVDSFGNELTIERDEEPEFPSHGSLWEWRIREQSEAGLVTEHKLVFELYAGGDPYRWVVHELDLQVSPESFTAGQPITQSRRAKYSFTYAPLFPGGPTDPNLDETLVYRPPANTAPAHYMTTQGPHEPMRVPMLKSVTLPDGSKWQFRYQQQPINQHPPAGTNGRPWNDNLIEGLTYPTGGGMEYQWTTYTYPRRACFHPQDRDPIPRASYSSGLKTRQLLNADGTPNGAPWRYFQSASGGPTVTPTGVCVGFDTFINAVVDPLANITVNYFTAVVNTGDHGNPLDYGLPFSSNQEDAVDGNRRLSTQVSQCPSVDLLDPAEVGEHNARANALGPHASCTVRRKTYVRYESSGQNCDYSNEGNAPCVSANRRLAAEKTVYVDDGNTWTLVEHSDFDGLGHYRKTTRTGNFFSKNYLDVVRPHGDQKISRTNYNRGVTFNLAGQQFFGAPANWQIDTYDEISEEEPAAPGDPVAKGGVARTEYFFDTRGFLTQKRTRGGAGRTGTDLLTTYERIDDTAGRIRLVERYYGGDDKFLPADDLPIDNPGTADYVIEKTMRFGSLEKTEYKSCDGAASVLIVQQSEIDPSTGLTMSTRDSTGATTTFLYDLLNRVVETRPPGEARTEYTYTRANHGGGFTPASVTAVRHTSGNGPGPASKPETKWTFDAFGRLAVTSSRLPDLDGDSNRWNRSETEYYPNGWLRSQTTIGVAGQANNGKTRYTKYDPFGRVLTEIHADSNGEERRTTNEYKGSRELTTTTTAAATSTNEVVSKQYFDSQGRLSVVEEKIAGTPRTFYEHDSSNRLVKVIAGAQTRTYEYDNRGFLRNEKHPELGANGISYGSYDARGNYRATCYLAGLCSDQRTTWHPLDRTMVYDGAERLTLVRQPSRRLPGNQPAPLKSFSYYRQGDFRGLLKQATRHNYIYEPRAVDQEIPVAVTEDFEYWPSTRRLKRTILSAPGVRMAPTFYYDDLGNLSQTDYPLLTINCEPGADCQSAGPVRNIQNRYMYGMLRQIPGVVETIDYHGNGLASRVRHANNVTWHQEIAAHNLPRPDRIRVVRGAAASLWNSGFYNYDGAGLISQIDSDQFTYDQSGRLVKAVMSGGAGTQNFNYDRFGNHAPFPSTQISAVSATNRLHADVGTYDVAGNLRTFRDPRQSGTAYNYEYDPYNMIRRVRVMENGGLVLGRMFLYDASDERVATIEYAPAPSQVRETWSARDVGNRVIRDFQRLYNVEAPPGNTPSSRGWSWSRDYVFRGSTLAASIDGTGTTHLHVDHLGTPRLTTDSAGQPSAVRIFRPFGEEMVATQDASRLKFTGHERDAMADRPYGMLDYMHARYYNPLLGKFLSVDPGRDINPKNPQSWNLYTYVRNNPIGATDPTGRITQARERSQGPANERCTGSTGTGGGCQAQANAEREARAKSNAEEEKRKKNREYWAARREEAKQSGDITPSGEADKSAEVFDWVEFYSDAEGFLNIGMGWTAGIGVADINGFDGAQGLMGEGYDQKVGLVSENSDEYRAGFAMGLLTNIAAGMAYAAREIATPLPPGPKPRIRGRYGEGDTLRWEPAPRP